MPGRPGLSALDLFWGKVVWNVPAPLASCHYAGDRSKNFSKGTCIRCQSALERSCREWFFQEALTVGFVLTMRLAAKLFGSSALLPERF